MFFKNKIIEILKHTKQSKLKKFFVI